MDEEQQRGPERNKPSVVRRSQGKDPIHEAPGTYVQQQVQEMVTDGIIVVEEPIQQERSVQHRPHHVIQMVDKRVQVFKMRVDENRIKVVVLKGTPKRVGIGNRGHREESGTDKQRAQR